MKCPFCEEEPVTDEYEDVDNQIDDDMDNGPLGACP